MTTATILLPRLRIRSRPKVKRMEHHFPYENVALWTLAFAAYITVSSYVVFHVGYMQGDAYSRVDNAFNVIGTRDPHLGAIGLVWPPLPSFLTIPVLLFRGLWPPLLTQGFAGSIVASACSAGTVVLFNSGLRWAGVLRGMRWVLCAIWVLNPMTLFYATSLESEPVLIFFAVATLVIFLRWAESRRAALLPLLGIVAGLACLSRVEAVVLALFVGGAVLARSFHRGVSWRELETTLLLYALPALFTFGLWIGSMAVLVHDPLYLIHSGYGNAGNAALVGTDAPLSTLQWAGGLSYIGSRSVQLFPAVVPLLAMLAARMILRPGRLTGLLLLLMGTPIMFVDLYLLHKGQLTDSLRYQIYVIPFTFVLAVYVLRSLKSRRLLGSFVGVALATLLGFSNLATAVTMGDPHIGKYEYPFISALATGQPLAAINPSALLLTRDADASRRLASVNSDHGLVLCDSAQCNIVVTTSPDPTQFVVTSDIDFEAAAAQPAVYHVEYFLVPQPAGLSLANRLNRLYPSLWATGAGFAKLVSDLGGNENWRLYRIIGPTGRG